jgi:peptidoglycan/xylan/chitin deacetylase (PgdA/CDA1 family)
MHMKGSKKLYTRVAIGAVILVIILGTCYFMGQKTAVSEDEANLFHTQNITSLPGKKTKSMLAVEQKKKEEEKIIRQQKSERNELAAKAERLAMGYNYDKAVKMIKSYEGDDGGYEAYPKLLKEVKSFEKEKDGLVLYGGSYTSVTQFSHIFFHSLVADNSKAFDGDYKETGYNQYMTTTSEFQKMMEWMYDNGYVLVSIHDIAKEVKNKDGSTKFEEGKIYLPKGKKPFVLSQDDVNYYDYMTGDGFASRIVVGEDSKPACEMIEKDGSKVTGSFDLVPILDAFVEEHPDFSYHGARGILAITGYEGVLGYRTNNFKSSTYKEDIKAVKKVAKALREDGWEFASHGWGHRHSQQISYKELEKDTKRWKKEVQSLIGDTDIYIFPYGEDIENTMGLYSSNKYKLLKKYGFRYYCGVYKKPWMQVRNEYVRMTRRPLDGMAMLEYPERLADLFDVSKIIDPDRPKRSW